MAKPENDPQAPTRTVGAASPAGPRPSTVRTFAAPKPRASPSTVRTMAAPSSIRTMAARKLAPDATDRESPDEPVTQPNKKQARAAKDSVEETRGFEDLPRPNQGGLARDLALAKVEQGLLGSADNAPRLGRFVVLDRLGAGAMGVVYAGYDPKLDRKVAIMVVDSGTLGSMGDEAHKRLELEARAAATLSHPNVVTVYDVGDYDDQVFLAMEYVEGQTLTAWLQAEARTWREIVRMFIEVARGLAAAHDAGVIHRDLKPDNVLVGADGRPRVADLGLARPTEGWTARDAARVLPSASLPASLRASDELATTGEVAGTPAYMAPEQYVGVNVGPHSDQFAFFVALYEGLYGRRPFEGDNVTEIAIKVIEGKIDPAPRDRDVPARLATLIYTGLSLDPGDRLASMHAVVDRLERILNARRRRIAMGVTSGLVVLGLGAGFQVANATADQPCEGFESELADAWGPQRKAEIASALSSAEAEATAVVDSLDSFAATWVERREDVCEAHRVRGDQTEYEASLRFACLDRARVQFDTLGKELAMNAPFEQLSTGSIAELLPQLADCDDVSTLSSIENNRTREGRSSVAAERAWKKAIELNTRARTNRALGRDGWVEDAQEALALGEEHGLSREQSDAMDLLGMHAFEVRGDLMAADAFFQRGWERAVLDVDDVRAAWHAIHRAEVAAHARDFAAAKLHLTTAAPFISRAAARTDELAAERVFELRAQKELVTAQLELGEGKAAEAKERLLKVMEDLAAASSSDFERLVFAQDLLGTAHQALGEYEASVAVRSDRLEALRQVYGDEHPDVVSALSRLGVAYHYLEQLDDADATYAKGLDLAKKVFGPEHPAVAELMGNWGVTKRHRGELEEAQRLQEQALAMNTEIFGEVHPALGFAMLELGEIALDRRDERGAIDTLDRAVAMFDKTLGPRHPQVAFALMRLGDAYLQFDQPDKAKGALDFALSVYNEHEAEADPSEKGETEFLLARTLKTLGQSAAAQELSSAARETYGRMGPHGADEIEAIEKWRSEQGLVETAEAPEAGAAPQAEPPPPAEPVDATG